MDEKQQEFIYKIDGFETLEDLFKHMKDENIELTKDIIMETIDVFGYETICFLPKEFLKDKEILMYLKNARGAEKWVFDYEEKSKSPEYKGMIAFKDPRTRMNIFLVGDVVCLRARTDIDLIAARKDPMSFMELTPVMFIKDKDGESAASDILKVIYQDLRNEVSLLQAEEINPEYEQKTLNLLKCLADKKAKEDAELKDQAHNYKIAMGYVDYLYTFIESVSQSKQEQDPLVIKFDSKYDGSDFRHHQKCEQLLDFSADKYLNIGLSLAEQQGMSPADLAIEELLVDLRELADLLKEEADRCKSNGQFSEKVLEGIKFYVAKGINSARDKIVQIRKKAEIKNNIESLIDNAENNL